MQNNNPLNTILFPVAPPYDMVYKNEVTEDPVGPHSHNAAELYYTLTDLPDVLLNDTVLEVKAGTLIIIPTFCTHQLYHEAGKAYERYILSINTGWIDAVFCEGASDFAYLSDSPSPLLLTLERKKGDELKSRFEKLLKIKDITSIAGINTFLDTLSFIHGSVKQQNPEKKQKLPVTPSQQRVNDIISYLQEHISENIGIPDIASHFFLNPDYLARLFKSHMHISIGHYFTLQKINAAEELLRTGSTVSEVQEILGYSSYAYFFKTFQKITGMSPSRYRSQYQKK
jgi:AraC-like DNA-binding protein